MRGSFAHACPIYPNLALTSAHTVDRNPGSGEDEWVGGRYHSLDGASLGVFTPVLVSKIGDYAVISLKGPVAGTYPLAAHDPVSGETVRWVEYAWNNTKDAGRANVQTSTVLRVVAGVIFLKDRIASGASGGCLLNSKDEVVGLITGRIDVSDGFDQASFAISVTQDWIEVKGLESVSQQIAESAKNEESK
jgi:V8-like Glu-specific endopeptidase